MLQELIRWIGDTPASELIATTPWVIPAVQTIHILAIAVVVSTMAMMDLRLMGLVGTRYPLRSVVDRYVPWMWISVLVLFCTGVVLITGEPGRALGNWVFQAKMALLCAVLTTTVVFSRVVRRLDSREQSAPQRLAARITGFVSLALWIGIVVAGRWIAYVL